MELTVVGSGAAYPTRPGTASSTYLLRRAGDAICLDLGQGGFAGVAGRMDPSLLGAVVISHLHPDHFVDLVALRHFLRWEYQPPRRVRVIAPAGLAERLDGLLGEPGFAAASLDIEVRQPGTCRVGPFVLESRLVTHTDASFGVRVTAADAPERPGLVYSGDCGRARDLGGLIHPGDVLLTEIAWGAGPPLAPDIHLHGAAIGELAAATSPGRILLTHLQPNRDPARAVESVSRLWGGDVTLVRDGDVVVV